MAEAKKPVAEQPSRARTVKEGHLAVAELVSDRAGGPSPFGDDQTFPLPLHTLRHLPPADK